MAKGHVLLVGDAVPLLEEGLGEVERVGYEEAGGAAARQRLRASRADAVVVAVVSAVEPGLELLRWLREHPIASPTLAILPEAPPSDLLHIAAEAVDDFILLPLRRDEWRSRLRRLMRPVGVVRRVAPAVPEGATPVLGAAPTFRRALDRLPLMARSRSPVLITGETGTGKELCARTIHWLSARRTRPFIAVDCGALPESLFENELYGHVRGAFTDAREDQRGLVALAEGGTLFLDEIDSLSLLAQGKLLRFLQEAAYRPLGSERFAQADVKVVAATNRPLERLVDARQFRSDLYFRLNVLRVHLVPLRDRREDIPLLASHFVETHAVDAGVRNLQLTPPALRKLMLYHWPGNVRELGNVIHQAVLLAQGPELTASDIELAAEGEAAGAEAPVAEAPFKEAKRRALQDFERGYVTELLRKHDGNITRAARDAKKERRAFGRLVKKYRSGERSA